MSNIIGKPHALKQVNLSLVRKAIKEKGSATRAEIVDATKISVTTVRTLLTEMLDAGEIVDGGHDKSIGGRKAVRYRLNKNKFFGAAFCLDGGDVRYLIVNICGETTESGSFAMSDNASDAICAFLDKLVTTTEIRSIGIGIPGVVDGMNYRRKNGDGELESYPIGKLIGERYGVPVVLENDLKATVLGFGRCYLKQYPDESCDNLHMAYIYFEKDCINAGFLSSGRILRGYNNFAGEVGFFPLSESKTLDEVMASPLDNEQYASIAAKLIAGVCCVLNPQYIALGASGFRKDCLSLITDNLYSYLPAKLLAEIVYAEDIWHDYSEGIAYLTADQIFADVRLIG